MKKIALGSVVVAVLACGVGCSSGEGGGPPPGPDFAAIEQRFENPDGTLSAGNVKGVLAGAQTGSPVPFFGGSERSATNGQSGTQSLGVRPLAGGFEGCAALQAGQRAGSCACPEGGSMSWEIQGSGSAGASDVTMRAGFDACGASGSFIDGTQHMRIQTSGSGQSTRVSMITVLDATVTRGGVGHEVHFQMRMMNDRLELAAQVDDGWVVVSMSAGPDGSELTVRAKNGSWTCKSAEDGGGTCTSGAGETVTYGG